MRKLVRMHIDVYQNQTKTKRKKFKLNNKVNKVLFLSFNWIWSCDHVLHQKLLSFFLYFKWICPYFAWISNSVSRNNVHQIELFNLYSKFYVPWHFFPSCLSSLSLFLFAVTADDVQSFFFKIDRNNAHAQDSLLPTLVNCFQ